MLNAPGDDHPTPPLCCRRTAATVADWPPWPRVPTALSYYCSSRRITPHLFSSPHLLAITSLAHHPTPLCTAPRAVAEPPDQAIPVKPSCVHGSPSNGVVPRVGDMGRRPRAKGPLASPHALSSAIFERAQVGSYEPEAPWRHQARLASAYIDSQMNLRISGFLTGR
jgi:hypothetical protein